MTERELIGLAVQLGFANAVVMDTRDLQFVPSFRPLCEENLCGKFGVNYACPPACGTAEEMRERVLRWKRALVMQTLWDIEDPMDEAQTKPAKSAHNKMTRQLIDRASRPGLMVGAGGCGLCSPCAMAEGIPCRFPDKAYSCMSAYCIFVQEMAASCGMEYDCGPGLVAFFSMFCFDPDGEDRDAAGR
jgi:predicted metal-binding protein